MFDVAGLNEATKLTLWKMEKKSGKTGYEKINNDQLFLLKKWLRQKYYANFLIQIP